MSSVTLFGGQSEHEPSPLVDLNVPIAQALHVVTVFVYPALQIQLFTLGLPSIDAEFNVQSIQTALDTPVVPSKYVLEGQLIQPVFVLVFLYLPAEQAKHCGCASTV